MWGIKNDALYPQRVCTYFLNCQTILNFPTIYFAEFSDNCIFIHRLFTISRFCQNFQNPPFLEKFPISMFFQNKCSRFSTWKQEQVFALECSPIFLHRSCGIVYNSQSALVEKVREKFITRFYEVKCNSTNLSPQVSIIIQQICTWVNIKPLCILYT